ncbi:PREDICTED: T-cell receptor-associated transmembrane adapter 1 [Ceratotherium simum simum]|nr:PREDICTED: T-cell receptor-associated transmembrane adapter 1 [Ceratotherium simum simum]
MVSEPMDENCYEQMKARPERSVNQLQEATAPAQATNEARMFYASLAPSQERKHRKPRKHDAYLSDKDGDEQLHARKASLSKTSLVDSFPPESQAVEEDIHDDPIRLFGLIRAKKEPTNQMDYDLAQ